jgi:hypothetical protein
MSQRYAIQLSEQEILYLKQLAAQPGFEPLLKLLQVESLDAQSDAMDCEELDDHKRSLALLKAQVTRIVVSNITKKLCAYRELLIPTQEEQPELARIIDNVWDTPERTN